MMKDSPSFEYVGVEGRIFKLEDVVGDGNCFFIRFRSLHSLAPVMQNIDICWLIILRLESRV